MNKNKKGSRDLAGYGGENVEFWREKLGTYISLSSFDPFDDFPFPLGKDPAAIPLLGALLLDKDLVVRHNALGLLDMHGQRAKRVLSAITTCLSDKNFAIRRDAAQLLGNIGSPETAVLSKLEEAARNDSEEVVRLYASIAFAKLDPASESGMVNLLRFVSSEHFYIEVFSELPNLVLRRTKKRLDVTPVWQSLQNALHSRDPSIIVGAANALESIGPIAKSLLPDLHSSLKNDDSFLCLHVFDAIWNVSEQKIGHTEIITAFLKKAKYSNTKVAAINSLAKRRTKAPYAVTALINAALNDPEEEVRQVAQAALDTIDPRWKTRIHVQ